jgi:hypothetical protein
MGTWGSAMFKLNSVDWKKIGKGLLIAMAGAGLTYITEIFTDLGWTTPVVVTAWRTLVNFIRKWLADNTR